MRSILLFLTIATLVFSSCKKDEKQETSVTPPAPFAFKVPEGWPAPSYNFEDNKVTRSGFELGRHLFYDTQLSKDNSISCGSCHQPFVAFAHAGHVVSHGVNGLVGTRNSPGIYNLAWHTSFMWHGGVNHLEMQPLAPIANPVEMDENINNIITKLQSDIKYPGMFKKAFGDEQVTSERILKSFAQFMGMMVSANSKYDKYVRGEQGGEMTTAELNGLNIFRQKCGSCHTEPLFSDFTFRNNGLPVDPVVDDRGREVITGLAEDRYKFKVPSLRNVAYTAPYMHDGRFQTLEQSLDHYISGIAQTDNLDPLLQNGISLSAAEKQEVILFLKTLSDVDFISDQRFKEVH